jgi:hypothetical protein
LTLYRFGVRWSDSLLWLLAPDIIEAILDGRQPTEMTLAVLMRPFAVAWTEQRKAIFCWKNATSVSG